MATNIETGDTTHAFSAWERRTRIWAFVVALLSLALWVPIGFIVITAGRPFGVTAGLVVTATVAV